MLDSADLILENANLITLDKSLPRAQALAINGDLIVKIGSNQDIKSIKKENTRVIDCQGKTLIPGFNDAHCHVDSLVNKLFSLDLSPQFVASIKDIQKSIHHKASFSKPGTWISGSGYNEFYLEEKRHPTRFDLDEASPDNPVILFHRSSHACVLNSLALTLMGIGSGTEEPAGGIIERDLENGEPNGILYEMSSYIRDRLELPLTQNEYDWAIAQVNEIYLSQGIISIGEASVNNGFSQFLYYQKIKESRALKSRIYLMIGMKELQEFVKAGFKTGYGDKDLRLGSLKIILNQATGQLQPNQAELNSIVIKASQSGFQLAIHAVESSEVEAAAIALENNSKSLPKFNARHRIEHCSECPPNLIKRLHKLGVLVVSQPAFLYFSGERYLAQVPLKTQQWLYPFKGLLDSGIILASGSDSPVIPNNPLIGIYSAITRKADSGQQVLIGESIAPEQALEMYTLNGAYASFEENIKGSLSPGKLADIVMLSADPLKTDPDQIKEIRVEKTIIGGEVVWEKN
jgi:predicted amidohydrolase YtcJ